MWICIWLKLSYPVKPFFLKKIVAISEIDLIKVIAIIPKWMMWPCTPPPTPIYWASFISFDYDYFSISGKKIVLHIVLCTNVFVKLFQLTISDHFENHLSYAYDISLIVICLHRLKLYYYYAYNICLIIYVYTYYSNSLR